MKVHPYSKAVSWITRPRVMETATLETYTPELERMNFRPGSEQQVAGLSDVFPGTFTSYNDAVHGGFQGTMEEWLQQQSIPQTERPFTGKTGGRVYDTRKYFNRGQLVQPGPGRQGYNGEPKSKWDTEELNKASQHYHKKEYVDLKTRKEKALIASNLSKNNGKFELPTNFEKLSLDNQNKLKTNYPEYADADFDKYKWGYDPNDQKTKSKANKIRYIVKNQEFKGTKAGVLSPEKQADVIRVFGDEWQGKWDFNKYKYGIPETGKGGKNTLLGQRIFKLVSGRSGTPQKIGFSHSVDENYLLNNFIDASKDNPAYTLLKDSEGNIKGVNINGQKYYHYKYPANLMQPGDKLITDHPSNNKIQRYLKFANEAKGNKSKFLNELFIKHNYKVPTVTQLLRHFWNTEGTVSTKNAIQKHHPGRVENIPDHLQLLDQWKNIDARDIHRKVDKNLMSQADAHIELKRKGIQIILDDGTKLGAPDIDPAKQMRDYEKFAERKVKQVVKAGKLPQLAEKLGLVKNNIIANASPQLKNKIAIVLKCKTGRISKAEGGRIGFAFGSGDPTSCITSKLEADPKGTLSKITQGVPELKNPIMKTLRPDLTAKGWSWADVERMNIKPGVFQKLGAKSPANLAKLGRYGLRGARWLLDPIELLLAAPITAYEGNQGYKQKMTDVESN